MYSARPANRNSRPAISLSGSPASSPVGRSAAAARYCTTPSRVRPSARIAAAPERAAAISAAGTASSYWSLKVSARANHKDALPRRAMNRAKSR